jgi:hypothetical protein
MAPVGSTEVRRLLSRRGRDVRWLVDPEVIRGALPAAVLVLLNRSATGASSRVVDQGAIARVSSSAERRSQASWQSVPGFAISLVRPLLLRVATLQPPNSAQLGSVAVRMHQTGVTRSLWSAWLDAADGAASLPVRFWPAALPVV